MSTISHHRLRPEFMILIVIAVVAGFVLGCLFRSESLEDGGNAQPVVPHPRALGP